MRLHATCLFLCAGLCGPALAEPPAPPATPTIELSADAQRAAPNDLLTAQLFVEQTDAQLAAVARHVNRALGSALDAARATPGITVRSGNTRTFPVYARNSTRIEAWRLRAEIVLESRDPAVLGELIGRLQAQGLGVDQLVAMPAPDTRRKAEDEAVVAALGAFRERAALVAKTLGHAFRIKHASVQTSGSSLPPPVPRVMAMARSEAAPAPVEAGDTQVSVTVQGQIKLLP